MPYLYDETQQVAARTRPPGPPRTSTSSTATCGSATRAPRTATTDPAQNAAWLRDALDALLAGREVAAPETEPVGCSIKWK